MLDNAQAAVAIAAGCAAIVAAVAGWLRYIQPKIKKAVAKVDGALDVLNGREAIVDNVTGRRIPGTELQGIGVRMAESERQLSIITEAVAKIADTHVRLEHHDARLDRHDEEIAELKAASVERVVARAESAAAWRAVEAIHTEQIESD